MNIELLSPMAFKVLDKSGNISDYLRASLENLCCLFDSEDLFLNAVFDFVELIREDPEAYLEFFSYCDSSNSEKFYSSVNELCTFIQKTIACPIDKRK
jgi:hypothetical protein